jgi:hypothetical protein
MPPVSFGDRARSWFRQNRRPVGIGVSVSALALFEMDRVNPRLAGHELELLMPG